MVVSASVVKEIYSSNSSNFILEEGTDIFFDAHSLLQAWQAFDYYFMTFLWNTLRLTQQ